jgi:hypothetical protein
LLIASLAGKLLQSYYQRDKINHFLGVSAYLFFMTETDSLTTEDAESTEKRTLGFYNFPLFHIKVDDLDPPGHPHIGYRQDFSKKSL